MSSPKDGVRAYAAYAREVDREQRRILAMIAEQRYVSLTTFRRSGAHVATPVWIAGDGDELVVITVDDTGKTRRLARDPRVELRPCDFRGLVLVLEGAPTYAGSARVVRDPTGVTAVKGAISAKYLMARLGDAAERVLGHLLRRRARAGIRITLLPDLTHVPRAPGRSGCR